MLLFKKKYTLSKEQKDMYILFFVKRHFDCHLQNPVSSEGWTLYI